MVSRGYARRLRRNAAGLVFECLYCGNLFGLEAFTEEHIWAERLGGEFGPDWFKTLFVCQSCNSRCGLHVDAEYALTLGTTTELMVSAHRFLDTSRPSAMPLVYAGRSSRGAVQPDEVCEHWLGPRGETIYHFRRRSDPYFDAIAGGNPVQLRKNPGRVYMSLSDPNLFWVTTALLSLRRQFGAMKLFTLTRIDDSRLTRLFNMDDERSAAERAFIASDRVDGSLSLQMTLNADWGRRYLCKLALGFGFQMFGYEFLELASTAQLRSAVAENDFAARDGLELHGSDFFESAQSPGARILRLEGAFVLAFTRHRSIAGLSVITPTGRLGSVRLTEDAHRLPSAMFDQYGEGFVIVLVPSLKRHWGPYALVDYIGHRCGSSVIPELAGLEGLRRSRVDVEAALALYPTGQVA